MPTKSGSLQCLGDTLVLPALWVFSLFYELAIGGGARPTIEAIEPADLQ